MEKAYILLNIYCYNFLSLMDGDNTPDANTIKKAGWKIGGTVIGWILIAGAIISLVSAIYFTIKWMMGGWEPGHSKKSAIGAWSSFIFCSVIGAVLLAALGISISTGN